MQRLNGRINRLERRLLIGDEHTAFVADAVERFWQQIERLWINQVEAEAGGYLDLSGASWMERWIYRVRCGELNIDEAIVELKVAFGGNYE